LGWCGVASTNPKKPQNEGKNAMSTAQTKAARKSAKSKPQNTSKPKMNALKNTFRGVHGVCPELVNLFNYMVDQKPKGSQEVTLRDVERYSDNIHETLILLR
jgi:hypothetical protein